MSNWLTSKHQFEVIDNRVIEYKKVIVHEFFVNEEDAVLFAAEELWKWEQSEAGQWVMKHAVEKPSWHKYENPAMFGANIYIMAKFKDQDYTFWQLKWGK